LGAFLLLRVCPILDLSTTLTTLVVLLGLATAALSALAARVQTDVKSGLAYASLTQVGIIIVEIGIGFRYLALAHIIGHACLRSLQLLRAPTLLHDYHTIENAIGGALDVSTATTVRTSSAGKWHIWLYRLGFERGFLDAILDNYVVTPFMTAFRWLDSTEQRWCYLIEGESTVEATDPLPLVEEES
jgi:NAD(P)H-quinone oxidoreductase subunit 5